MTIREADIRDYFFIEEIDAPSIEKETLNVIGINEGIIVQIMGNGYLKDSIIVKREDGLVLQLNSYFTKSIKGSIVKNKKLVK